MRLRSVGILVLDVDVRLDWELCRGWLTSRQNERSNSHAVSSREPAQVAIVMDVKVLGKDEHRGNSLVHCCQGKELRETKNKDEHGLMYGTQPSGLSMLRLGISLWDNGRAVSHSGWHCVSLT